MAGAGGRGDAGPPEARADLIVEPRRNAELRAVCGFDPLRGAEAVPADDVFSRFARKLHNRRKRVDAIVEAVAERLGRLPADLGRRLAADSKALVVRGRRPADAQAGTKTYETVREDGTARKSVVEWFGYKPHLLVDATYEMPLARKVTEAGRGDSPELAPRVEHLENKHPALHQRAETLAADRGCDDGADKADLCERTTASLP